MYIINLAIPSTFLIVLRPTRVRERLLAIDLQPYMHRKEHIRVCIQSSIDWLAILLDILVRVAVIGTVPGVSYLLSSPAKVLVPELY
jgi:hypothetical protein